MINYSTWSNKQLFELFELSAQQLADYHTWSNKDLLNLFKIDPRLVYQYKTWQRLEVLVIAKRRMDGAKAELLRRLLLPAS